MVTFYFTLVWFGIGAIVASILYREARRVNDAQPKTLAALGFVGGPILLVLAIIRAFRIVWRDAGRS